MFRVDGAGGCAFQVSSLVFRVPGCFRTCQVSGFGGFGTYDDFWRRAEDSNGDGPQELGCENAAPGRGLLRERPAALGSSPTGTVLGSGRSTGSRSLGGAGCRSQDS